MEVIPNSESALVQSSNNGWGKKGAADSSLKNKKEIRRKEKERAKARVQAPLGTV